MVVTVWVVGASSFKGEEGLRLSVELPELGDLMAGEEYLLLLILLPRASLAHERSSFKQGVVCVLQVLSGLACPTPEAGGGRQSPSVNELFGSTTVVVGMTVGDRIVAGPGGGAVGGVAVGVALGGAAVGVAVGGAAVGVAVGGVSISISSWLLNTPTVFSSIELEAWCARRRVFKQGALVELYRVGPGP